MRRRRVGVLALLGLLRLVGGCNTGAQPTPGPAPGATDWAWYGRDLQNGRTAAAGHGQPGPSAWTLTPAAVTSTPIVVGGRVCFAAWDGTLRAVSVRDGAALWTTTLQHSANATPVYADGALYLGDSAGVLYRVNWADGGIVWSSSLDPSPGASLYGSPVVVDGLVILGVASYQEALPPQRQRFRGSLVALDPATGQERWRLYTTPGDATAGPGVAIWSTPVFDAARDLVFVGTGNTYDAPAAPLADGILAVHARTGTLAWHRQFTAGDVFADSHPVGPDSDVGATANLFTVAGRDVVGVGDKGGHYTVMDRDSGEVVWTRQLTPGNYLGGVMASTAVADGTVYVVSNRWANLMAWSDPGNGSTAFALNAADGSTTWQTALPSPCFGGLVVAGDDVYVPTVNGTIYGVRRTDGGIAWRSTATAPMGGSPSVAEGYLFVPFGFSDESFRAPGGLSAFPLPN